MDERLVAIERLLSIMERLRVECPWDREQTFDTLRSHTIEEAFELADAIVDGDNDGIREELGDVLLHIVFYCTIATENEWFTLSDVANSLCDKLIYRHPHVFGSVEVDGAQDVIHNWEKLKLTEKRKSERKNVGGVLGGVPRSLPAMVKALRIGEKAAGAGFDWQQREDVWGKVEEEITELKEAFTEEDFLHKEEELGDTLFAIINAARLYGIDPETALERTNKKFISRFNYIEARAAEQGKPLTEFSLDQMEQWWQEAKNINKQIL